MKILKKKMRLLVLKLGIGISNFKLKNSIVICGEARSGSTWLMEILHQIPGTVINWEPLQAKLGVVPKKLNFGWRPHIPEDDTNPVYISLFQKILTFRLHNAWTTKFLKYNQLFNSKIVITKFVRANGLLPWLVARFGSRMNNKPIYLVRHPITNCISLLKTFEGIQGVELTEEMLNLPKFAMAEGLNSNVYGIHGDFANKLNTKLERRIATWCMHNVPILNHPKKEQWIEIRYENLMLKPHQELTKMRDALAVTMDQKIFEKFDFGRASASNYKGDFKKDPKLQLEAFLKDFDDDYLTKIQRIFDYFELTTYSAFNAYPIDSKN